MDELPELPFEKVLSYLSLQDRLKLSAVSRSCHQKIANSRVKTLCYSERPSGFIRGKSRWAGGTFAQNFISSNRIECFFDAFGRSILANLKHLRLCDLDLSVRGQAAFTHTLNSFGQLEKLDIIRAKCSGQRQLKLNLPALTSLHLEELTLDRKLTLEAPTLRNVKLLACADRRLDIVHGESVERLVAEDLKYTAVTNLKNLKYLSLKSSPKSKVVHTL